MAFVDSHSTELSDKEEEVRQAIAEYKRLRCELGADGTLHNLKHPVPEDHPWMAANARLTWALDAHYTYVCEKIHPAEHNGIALHSGVREKYLCDNYIAPPQCDTDACSGLAVTSYRDQCYCRQCYCRLFS